MLTLNDGRTELWQWDTGRTLDVDADCSQVHFSNKVFGRSIDVDVIDGVSIIPDILLQTDKELTAWAFVGTPENGYTKISKVFKVNRRNKPADYVFTPTEQTTLGELVERLEKIEESQDPDAIKNAVDDYLANNPIEIDETDPTVSEWAKQPQKPAYTAQEVGALPATTHIPSTADDVNAEPSGAVSQHNVSDAAHSDIRLLIQGVSERLSAVADSDDATLDQLSEIVAYIKSNKILIDAITTSKVNVADIVDNLTTNVANKPLSAAQGVALKAIIDALTIPTKLSDLTEDTTHRVVTDAEKAVWNAKSNFTGSYNDLTDKPTIPDVPVQSVNGKTGAVELSAGDVGALPDSTVIPEAYTLPIASPTVLGGVQPVAKTDAMTQSVGVDEAGALWAAAGGGGGSGGEHLVLLNHVTLAEDAHISVTKDLEGNPISENRIIIIAKLAVAEKNKDDGLLLNSSEQGGIIAAWGLKTGTSGFYHFHEITVAGDYAYDRYSAGPSIGSTTNNSFFCYSIPFKGKITGFQNYQQVITAGSEFWLYAVR